MLFKWLIDSIFQEESIQWNHVVEKLNEECLLSIERYEQMEKRIDDAKFFMQCIVYRKLIDKQKKDFKHSSIMCSMRQWQNEKSTQTKIIIKNESQLIDDVISKFIKVESEFVIFFCSQTGTISFKFESMNRNVYVTNQDNLLQ